MMAPGQPEFPLCVGREDPPSLEGDPFLDSPKSEKHVSFGSDLQYHEIESNRSKQRRRLTSRIHIFGILALLFTLLFYTHAWKVGKE